MKSLILLGTLLLTGACSSMNQVASDVARDASMVESTAGSIDRAIATGERVEKRFETKK